MFQYAIKACVPRLLWEPGGIFPGKFYDFLIFLVCFWCTLGVKLQKVGRPTTKPGCYIWSPQNQRRDSTSGRRGCIVVGYSRKAQENKSSHTDSITPSLSAEGALLE